MAVIVYAYWLLRVCVRVFERCVRNSKMLGNNFTRTLVHVNPTFLSSLYVISSKSCRAKLFAVALI